jgi:mannose-6-phosphate isomerase-like protein (cupin superfamily)
LSVRAWPLVAPGVRYYGKQEDAMETRHRSTRRQLTGALAVTAIGGYRWAQTASAGGVATPVVEEQPMTETITPFHVVEHDAAETVWMLGTLAHILGDSDQTANAFCMVEFLQGVGFATPLHTHHTADEVFYVLEGTMHGVCDDEEWFAHQGALVWLPKKSVHGWAVFGDAQVRSLAMCLPGGFDKFVQEAGEPAQALTLPPATIEINPERIAELAEKYGQSILGPPVNYLN